MPQDHQQQTIRRIMELKQQRQAVILAHNYQRGEVQDIADFVGDSLELSIKAAAVAEANVIVFCGVKFMAETAKILSPDKTVLLPRTDAGCPMADMATAEQVREYRKKYPKALFICYVNSSIEVKAECDLCCTSANASNLVRQIPQEQEIVFLPDRNLGANVEKQCQRTMILWPGFCPTHAKMIPDLIMQGRAAHPGAPIIVHPECDISVTGLADEALSTGGMLRYARTSQAATIIVGTEVGLLHRLRNENPDKKFIPLWEHAICPNMKLTTLSDIMTALENMAPEITVEEEIRKRAEIPLRRMLEGKW